MCARLEHRLKNKALFYERKTKKLAFDCPLKCHFSNSICIFLFGCVCEKKNKISKARSVTSRYSERSRRKQKSPSRVNKKKKRHFSVSNALRTEREREREYNRRKREQNRSHKHKSKPFRGNLDLDDDIDYEKWYKAYKSNPSRIKSRLPDFEKSKGEKNVFFFLVT